MLMDTYRSRLSVELLGALAVTVGKTVEVEGVVSGTARLEAMVEERSTVRCERGMH